MGYSYFFYPETAHRSLEEIDLIFAKGYNEKNSYVKASKELPRLTVQDMEALATQYGLTEASEFEKTSSLNSQEQHSLPKVGQLAPDVTGFLVYTCVGMNIWAVVSGGIVRWKRSFVGYSVYLVNR